MLKVIIIDDEKYAVEALGEIVAEDGRVALVGSFVDVRDAIAFLEEHEVDLVYSDIEMPGMNGIEFGQFLQSNYPETGLVYITAYSNYALEAYNTFALGYLLKPVLPDNVKTLMDKLLLLPKFKSKAVLKIKTLNGKVFEKDGVLMKFRTKRTMELLCFLLHQNGVWTSSDEILDRIWGNRHESSRKQLHTTLYHLRQSFKNVGASQVLQAEQMKHKIDMEKIEWDYLTLLDKIKFFTKQKMGRDAYLEMLEYGQCKYFEYEWATDTFYYFNALFAQMIEYQDDHNTLSEMDIERLAEIV